MREMMERILCPYLPGGRAHHCSPPKEHNSRTNILDRGNSAEDPSEEPEEPEPSKEDCTTDEEGNFGSRSDASAFQEVILYQYQVQTTLSFKLDNQGLNALERQLGDVIIPLLFDHIACEEQRRHLRALQATPEERDLTGLESAPEDQIAPGLEGVLCRTDLVPGADRCFVVNGGLSLVGDMDIAWAVPPTINLIKHAMENGKLDNVNEDVVDVEFLQVGHSSVREPEQIGGAPTEPPGFANTSSSDVDISAQPWPWVILGIGLFSILALVFIVRRRRQVREEKDTYNGTPPSADEIDVPNYGGYSNPYLDEEDDRPLQPALKVIGTAPETQEQEPLNSFAYSTDEEETYAQARKRHFI